MRSRSQSANRHQIGGYQQAHAPENNGFGQGGGRGNGSYSPLGSRTLLSGGSFIRGGFPSSYGDTYQAGGSRLAYTPPNNGFHQVGGRSKFFYPFLISIAEPRFQAAASIVRFHWTVTYWAVRTDLTGLRTMAAEVRFLICSSDSKVESDFHLISIDQAFNRPRASSANSYMPYMGPSHQGGFSPVWQHGSGASRSRSEVFYPLF